MDSAHVDGAPRWRERYGTDYAYLRSQAGRGNPLADHAEGLLLHPSVGREVDETAVIQGHPIRFATVDLTGTGTTIRQRLLNVVTPIPVA